MTKRKSNTKKRIRKIIKWWWKFVEVIAVKNCLLRDMSVVLAGDTFKVDKQYWKLLKDKGIIN